MEEYNKTFQRDNPQYFIAPAPGQTTSDPAQMARNRAQLIKDSNGKLQEKNGKVVPIISSEGGKSTIDTAITEHKADITAKTPTPKEEVLAPEKPIAKKNPAMEALGAVTAEEASATGINLKDDYTYDTNTGYFIPKASTKERADTNAKFDEEERYVNETFDKYMASMDAATQSLVSAYKNTFAERMAEEKKITERAARSAQTINLRTGISRYAPGQAQAVLTSVEREGLDRIKKLGVEETRIIAEAEQSLAEKKYDIFMDKMAEKKALRKERAEKLDELQKEATEKLDELRKREAQVSRDTAIADLFAQGVTDPAQILDFMNRDEEGNLIGDVTAEEVGKVLKVIKPDESLAGLSADYKTYEYLKKIGDPSIAGMNYFDYQTAISNAQRKPETPAEEKPISLSADKKTKLLGAGFSQDDVVNIEKDVREFGLEKVLEGITDTAQKKALRETYGQEEKLTRKQIESSVTPKMAYDGLKDTYTVDELKELADENGVSSMWTGEEADVERFLNSAEGKKLYTELLFKQYEEAGMTKEEDK